MTHTQTHYEGCWKVHHACAVYRIGQLESKLEEMQAEIERLQVENARMQANLAQTTTILQGIVNEVMGNEGRLSLATWRKAHDFLQGGDQ